MSDTWQWVELSKDLIVKDLWVNNHLMVQKVKLNFPDVIAQAAKAMGYDENTTMYEILFTK